jgi:hypothetical protein
MGNFPLLRLLIGWVYPLNFQLMKLLSNEYMWDLVYTERHVLQDFMIPMSRLEDAVKLSHEEVEVSTK